MDALLGVLNAAIVERDARIEALKGELDDMRWENASVRRQLREAQEELTAERQSHMTSDELFAELAKRPQMLEFEPDEELAQ